MNQKLVYAKCFSHEFNGCSCAFSNTPKYNQVKGRGKIVTRSWIEKCYDSKKYLPWRRFALDSTELTKPESDEEILDEALRPKCNTPSDNGNYMNLEAMSSLNRNLNF